MMMNKKKVAMLIVRGMADQDHDKRDQSMEDNQGIKKPSEHKESDDSRMGVEMAAEKIIGAVKDGDAKKLIQALMEFQEMSSGMEYYKKESMHEDNSE